MAFISHEELVNLKVTNPGAIVMSYRSLREYPYDGPKRIPATDITSEVADNILANALTATLGVRQAKVNRPWELVDLTAKLDAKQPWLGFEYETGFDSKADYDRLINHLWHNVNHVAIDREGYGPYCPEITFSPENLSAYMNGTSSIQQVIGWMNDNKVPLAEFGPTYVGTHVNLSTPAYRKAGTPVRARCLSLINQSILTMTYDEHVELFGRKPYGLGSTQASWVEFKMFRSTDSLDVFNKYVEVSKNLAELMEYLVSNVKYAYANNSQFISNFADILRGEIKADKSVVKQIADGDELYNHATMNWRGRYGETYEHYQTSARSEIVGI